MVAIRKDPRGDVATPPSPWDPVVRITHWGIVFAVLLNGFVVEEGGTVHVWAGWIVLALLLVRLLWGIAGPAPACFASFPPDPAAALRHLRRLFRGKAHAHSSHNPAGAMMVYALWACLLAITLSGLVMTGGRSPVTIAEQRAAVAAGDWSVLVAESEGRDDDAEAGRTRAVAEELHEVVANLLLLLALVHVAGVAVESRAIGRNLVRPMIGGRKTR